MTRKKKVYAFLRTKKKCTLAKRYIKQLEMPNYLEIQLHAKSLGSRSNAHTQYKMKKIKNSVIIDT